MLSRSVPRATPRTLRYLLRPHLSAGQSSPRFARVTIPRCPRSRPATTVSGVLRETYKKYPFQFTLAMTIIAFGSGVLLYVPYYYYSYIWQNTHKFPKPVADKLKRALFHTDHMLDVEYAIRYYKQALTIADEMGMDPFSDEILGVKLKMAELFERAKMYKHSIEVLEIVRKDCLRWMEVFGDKHRNDGNRTRILKKAVEISVKLGQQYAEPDVWQLDVSEACFVFAIETILKESERRDTEGVKEGEGDWMTNEQTGAAIEEAAHHFVSKDKHYLASPLYLQALRLADRNSCHQAMLMQNISTSLAQQLSSTPFNSTLNLPLPDQAAYTAQARQWARKSLEIARSVPASSRTEECDIACAAAAHNLAEFEEMDGRLREALKGYQDAKKLAQDIGFKEGVQVAEAGMKRIRKAGIEG